MTFIPPMLARSTTPEAAEKARYDFWYAEPKYDGVRMVITREGMFSRTGANYLTSLPTLRHLCAVVPHDAAFDGELIAISKTFTFGGATVHNSDFTSVMRVLGSAPARGQQLLEDGTVTLHYVLFDVIVPDATQRARTAAVTRINDLALENLITPLTLFGGAQERLYRTITEHGGEGIMLKNPDALYVPNGRPMATWLKLKRRDTADVVIMGFTEGTGKYAGQIGAIEYGVYYPSGTLLRVGKCSGMSDAMRDVFSRFPGHYVGNVIEISFNGLTSIGSPRHPQFSRLRDDVVPASCTADALLTGLRRDV